MSNLGMAIQFLGRPEKQKMSLGKNKNKERSKKSASKAEEDAEDADMMQQYLPEAAGQS